MGIYYINFNVLGQKIKGIQDKRKLSQKNPLPPFLSEKTILEFHEARLHFRSFPTPFFFEGVR